MLPLPPKTSLKVSIYCTSLLLYNSRVILYRWLFTMTCCSRHHNPFFLHRCCCHFRDYRCPWLLLSMSLLLVLVVSSFYSTLLLRLWYIAFCRYHQANLAAVIFSNIFCSIARSRLRHQKFPLSLLLHVDLLWVECTTSGTISRMGKMYTYRHFEIDSTFHTTLRFSC